MKILILSILKKLHLDIQNKLRYKTKATIGKMFFKLRQMIWNVGINYVNIVVDELSSQIRVYTCLTIDIWTQQR